MSALQKIDRGISGNRVKPSAKAPLGVKSLGFFKEFEKNFLTQIFGVFVVLHHLVDVGQNGTMIPLIDFLEGGVVAFLTALEQGFISFFRVGSSWRLRTAPTLGCTALYRRCPWVSALRDAAGWHRVLSPGRRLRRVYP